MIAAMTLAVANAGGWNHMGGWGWGMAVFGWLFMVALVMLIGWLIWSTTPTPAPGSGGSQAHDLLDERYAQGEIARDEYLERSADLNR